MADKKITYKCTNPECGYTSSKRYGRCPMCKEWDSMVEVEETPKSELKNSHINVNRQAVQRLVDVELSDDDRIITNIKEFDRVMGGGIVKDSISVLSAPPGTGKTTLLLEVCNKLAEQNYNVLYATGEESATQIKKNALRILKNINKNLFIVGTNSLDNVINIIKSNNINIIVLDSIQRFRLDDFASHTMGSPIQIRECYNAMKSICKDDDTNKRACIMIGQVTKDDELRGSRELEHDVDAVLELTEETDSSEIRFLRAIKNRFGGPETGLFKMTDKGMISLDNPSDYFTTHRDNDEKLCGVAMSVILDGTRPIIIEVESLTSPLQAGIYATRIATCIKKDLLNILLSVLEQRARVSAVPINNIIVNTTTGIFLKERCTDLALVMAIYSSLKNKPLGYDTIYLAEIGLTGELKNVPSIERRIKEVERLGYKHVVISKNENIDEEKFKDIEIIKCRNLSQVIANLNSKK